MHKRAAKTALSASLIRAISEHHRVISSLCAPRPKKPKCSTLFNERQIWALNMVWHSQFFS